MFAETANATEERTIYPYSTLSPKAVSVVYRSPQNERWSRSSNLPNRVTATVSASSNDERSPDSSSSSNDDHGINSPDKLDEIARHCQEQFFAWERAQDLADQARYAGEYRRSLEALWEEIAPDLRRVARGWIRSGMAPDIETLAMNMFTYIVFKLPTLAFDAQRNIRGLLVTVARRGMSDDYYRSYANSPKRQPNSTVSFDDQLDLADEARSEVENDTIQKVNSEEILSAVDIYWDTLEETDRQIMHLRWRTDPPGSFRDIARQLGPGWAEDAVRQRHHRVINATRKQLRDQKLLDDVE